MLTQAYQIEQTGNVAVVQFRGRDISGLQMQELVVELEQKMRYESITYFVFDMASVEYMASTCLGVLVAFLQDLEPVRGRLALAHVRSNVQFLFKVTRLNQVFTLCDDVEDAKQRMIKGK